jgi:prepilin-type N-terminal cleavage/methylation domain-containing protein
MRRKGFTLVELLVVIAIIALLMGILMPALSRVRQIAFRVVCGTNLSGIGKAMLVYSNDYDDELPRSGGRNSPWAAKIPNWQAASRFGAYGVSANGEGGVGSISSCLYLLVKYADVTPKSFICKGDSGAGEFKPANYGAGARDLIDLWDFGPEPKEHCSYAYHMPFGLYALTTSGEPGMAVAADRNPFVRSPMAEPKDISLFVPEGGREAIRFGNAYQHQEEGQNVLFLDMHVNFEKTPYCGINDDNIYTYWDGGDIRRGGVPVLTSQPQSRTDSMVVHDAEGGPDEPKGRTCFVADTPVWVDGALVRISEVALGETVGKLLCADQRAPLEQIEKVQEHKGTFECRDILLESGNCISVVDAHRFMLDSGRWIAAQDLHGGLRLKTLTGNIGIRSVARRDLPYVGKVYNLKVRNGERYAVGIDGVIVRDW